MIAVQHEEEEEINMIAVKKYETGRKKLGVAMKNSVVPKLS